MERTKPRILLATTGSVAAIKFGILCHSFSEWGEVKAVATKSSLHFIDRTTLPREVTLYTDEDEWSSWKKIGDEVLHIELRRWADIMVIAPLSANTLGKVRNFLYVGLTLFHVCKLHEIVLCQMVDHALNLTYFPMFTTACMTLYSQRSVMRYLFP